MRLLPRLLASILLAAALNGIVHGAEQDGLATKDAISEKTRIFMERLDEGRILAAYKAMKAVLGVDTEPFMEDAEKARKFFGQVRERVGEPLGATRVKRESIDDHFHRQSYLQTFESAALHWQFTFYRPADEWVLVGVSYSTNLDPLYQRD
jgi:hypothetical protein